MGSFSAGLSPLVLFGVGAVTLLLPLVTIVGTSFIRIAVVLNLLRQAIGAQNVPPTYVLNVVAAALTAAVMASPASDMLDRAQKFPVATISLDNIATVAGEVSVPLLRFMTENTDVAERDFMREVRTDRWSPSAKARFAEDSLFVVLPAFVMSEVKRGFEIGFLIYIPFVVIDVVVATIISSLGMSSVSPNIIGLPLKLLVFVYVDGWTQLSRSLIAGYA